MQELPEVETTLRGIDPYLRGHMVSRLIVRQPSLRWPVPKNLPAKVKGQTIKSLRRRGKYLLVEFARGTALMHLGMSGSIRIVGPEQALLKHDHVDWVMDSGRIARFNDPRRFGALLWTEDPVADRPLIKELGPEPLSDAFDGEWLFRRSRKRKQSIKTLIMDSKTVVGVGNIYANESLWAAGIDPSRPGRTVSEPEAALLRDALVGILRKAIEAVA